MPEAAVAIVLPLLRRPHRVLPVYESAKAATPHAHIVFVVSPEDGDVQRACAQVHDATILDVSWQGGSLGDYARKVNWAVTRTTEELVFLGADDLEFHDGWFARACRELNTTTHVVGTNDLANYRTKRGWHSTHTLLTREYAQRGTIDEPDKVLHEGYPHEFVDDEFVGTAIYRGVFVGARDSIVEHLHPMARKAPMDDLYAQQGRRMKSGRRLYERRRHMWAG